MTPIENIEILIEAVTAQPEELFDLSKYKREESCGTLFCTLGLAATLPEFQAQGLKIFQCGDAFDVTINDVHAWYEGIAEPVFGPNAFIRLFEPADCGTMDAVLGYDRGWSYGSPNMTDKELALKRLNRQLSILKEEK